MANASPTRLGEINNTGDDNALFLKVFSGMVLEAFDTNQVTESRVTMRTINSGKSAQFPLIWKGSAGFHTPGTEILGNDIPQAEKVISIEDLFISPVFIARIDEAKNHYDVRAPFAHQLGEALGNAFDKNNFRALFKGAKASHPITVASTDFDGTPIGETNLSTTATVAKAAIYDAARFLDEKDVPSEGRTAAFLPLVWYLLLENGEFLEREFGGEGSKSRALFSHAADLEVVKTNNIPTANETSPPSDVPAVLTSEDFREYVGGAWHATGLGVVKLLDLSTEMEPDVRRQGTLMVAKYAMGQDFLRTESCITFEDTAIV